MSLRGRLFVILLVVNLGLLGVVQVTGYVLQETWLDNNRAYYEEQIDERVLQFPYEDAVGVDSEAYAVETVRRLLDPALEELWSRHFRDVLITSSGSAQAAVDLNPLGAVGRDPRTFPLAEIREGIRAAMASLGLVRVGDGFAVAIARGGRAVGGAWFLPLLPAPPQVPFSVFALPVLVATLVLGALAYWLVERGLFRPLHGLEAAAARVGAGDYSARAERVSSGRELDAFVVAFNAMAERIEGHRTELEHEVRTATAEAKRKERALLQSARLASIGTLAAGIAHEINNPIGGMINAVRRLEGAQPKTARDVQYLELIREGLERVGNIARRLLDFAPHRIEPRPFALQDAVEGARALVDHRFRRQAVELRTDIPPDLPMLVGDRHEFQQVLLNLFINSLDVLEGRPDPRRIAVTGRAVAADVEIVVEDNGPGMDPALLPQVVDPFFTKKGRPDASGLGMFISYSIIRNLGGELELDSAPEKGFRVTIRLPT